MCERHRFSHETPELDVNCFPAAENGDDEDDDDEEEEERRHDEEEEEEEEPVWTASGALIGTSRFPRVLRSTASLGFRRRVYPRQLREQWRRLVSPNRIFWP